jgi:hypothetical protein
MSVLQPLRLKKEVLDTADPRQVPIPEVDRSVLDSDIEARVLFSVAEEGRGENEVMQPANPAANTAANAPANPAANALANAPANAGNAANNAANAANIQGNPAPNPRRNAGAQPPPVQPDRAEGSR